MDTQENQDMLDLGSTPVGNDFDPFADDELNEVTEEETNAAPTEEPSKTETPAKAVETKEKAEQKFDEKPPVFEYAGATENIEDSSKTFDELRIEKATDFPELEDGKKVSWTVEYGKISKTVSDPKGTSVGKMKSDIETSKEFTDSLKRAKDKNPTCKVKPRVTAQSKGNVSAYKGVFTNIHEAETSGKVISIIPAKDGKVYEIRNTDMGKFTTPTSDSDMLSKVCAGFIPALPHIPMDLTMRIVSFFRHYIQDGAEREVLVNVYWDKVKFEFFIDTPKQTVSKASVEGQITDEYACDRYIHYMDIHSHNSMKAFFSATDDSDERATRLYSVIGHLDKYFPEIKTRISNGGKFWPIDPTLVFEPINFPFPEEWKERVSFRSAHGDKKGGGMRYRQEMLDEIRT